ncbi:AAA family ATPase [Gloeothece verrucosa]|uniref:AAA family ATPase n=1 Tax=Gloeothece verrucosa TaxID=2546359 RepID=UPI00017E1D73|nr:AAA family ATPase [Gloeothece verrucosa]
MLEEIDIENFRCFEDTKISGFERVNLIGGKNNSGKTALLEALYLFHAPLPTGILFLMRLRKEFLSFSKAFPERTWNKFSFRRCS